MRLKRAIAVFIVAGILASSPAGSAYAAGTTFPNDTNVTLTGPGITLTILAGANVNSVTVRSTTITVAAASGDSLTLRYPGPNPGRLPNDGGLSECNPTGANNELTVTGPATVVITPNTTVCASTGGGSVGVGISSPPSVSGVRPNGGETWPAGARRSIFWTTNGGQPHTVSIQLSTDGGLTYTTAIASGISDIGTYEWQIPAGLAAAKARVRVQAVSGTTVISSDVSDADFSITGDTSLTTEPPPVTERTFTDTRSTFPTGTHEPVPYSAAEKAAPPTDPNATGGFDAASAVVATPTIDVDKGILPPPPERKLPCTGGSLIKIARMSDVYYCGKDGKRYVFPNAKTYFSWFSDYGGVTTISDEDMAAIPVGGNVAYKPGSRMVKIQTDPKVYALARNGTLRWVKDEAAAARLYGPDWNKHIDDVPDSFFVNYRLGDPIE